MKRAASRTHPRLRSWLYTLRVIVGIPLMFLTACQSKLIYFPRHCRAGDILPYVLAQILG